MMETQGENLTVMLKDGGVLHQSLGPVYHTFTYSLLSKFMRVHPGGPYPLHPPLHSTYFTPIRMVN